MKKIEKIEKQSKEIKRISYMAEDGEEFSSEEECLKYEKTALFLLNSKLKRLAKKDYIYENAKNTCDFSREMNWHDYFTKMIAF